MHRTFFISTMFFGSAIQALSAQVKSADRAIASLLNQDSQAEESARFLASECAPNTFDFMDAAANGNLYKSGGNAIGLADAEGANSYCLLYPRFEAIDSKRIRQEDLVKVSISRTSRLEFRKILPIIQLYSRNTQIRLEAYKQVCDLKQPMAIKHIRKALASEKDAQGIHWANEALYTLLLCSNDEKGQAEAVQYFSKNPTAKSFENLSNYAARKDISKANRSKAETLISDIRSHQRTVDIFQNIFSGLSLGSILIMVALGLSIIYGLAGIINMSHGEFIMIGAYTTFCIQQLFARFIPAAYFDLAFFISLPASFVVTSLFGLLIERLIIKHLYHRPLESLLATWGISLILIQLARNVFGDLTSVQAPKFLTGGWEITSGLILPYNRLFIIALTLVIFAGIYLLFKKSMLGIKIRAVTQNRNMSACLGINTKKIDMLTFMLGSGLAGVAGCAITLIGNVVPNMGQTYIVDSFLVVVSGGVGKLVGCVVSGFGIGIFSKIFEISFEAVYGKVLMLVFIIIFLQYKPRGLFPDKGRIGDN